MGAGIVEGIALNAAKKLRNGAQRLPRSRSIRSASRLTPPNRALELICQSISRLKYGHVVVYVQDGQVIQIDFTECIRLTTER